MAATNFTPIQLYYSTTASAVPLAANLAQGELAINITDGKLYYEDGSGVVQVIASKGAGTIGGSTTQIQYNNAGALAGNAAMTFNSGTNTTTLTTLNLTNALGAVYGGTGQTSYTTGDLLYSSASNTLAKLAIGTANYILAVNSAGTNVEWAAPTAISVNTATNLAGGVAGSVPYQSAAATTTFLAIGAANRVMTSTGTAPQWVTSLTSLTGVSSSSITNTSLNSGRVVYSGASGVQTDSASLTFNGTTLSAGGFSTTGLSTLVQTVKIGDSNFSGVAVFAPATPAKLYIGTGTVTDATSAIGATNATGAVASLAITPIAATNTSVTYTDAATLYIAGAPSAGTNITLTNPYALYIAAGNVYLGGGTANGVAYLNGSKVLTTGSALVFDGTNLGVGVTPSAWGGGAGAKAIQMGGTSFSFLAANKAQYIYGNAYYDGTNNRYINSDYACSYGVNVSGTFQWNTVASGTAGNTISFTQAMTLTAAGNLLIGTTTTANNIRLNEKLAIVNAGGGQYGGAALTSYSGTTAAAGSVLDFQRSRGTTDGSMTAVASNDSLAYLVFRGSDGTDFRDAGYIISEVDGTVASNQVPGRLVFATTNSSGTIAEKMRLDSSGNLGLGVTPSAWRSTERALQIGGITSITDVGAFSVFRNNNYVNSASVEKYIANGYASAFLQNSGEFAWLTAPSGTAGGTISFTTAMTLNVNGVLALRGASTSANGVGITFPTTQSASSNGKTLDDYEEGTFTPTIIGTSGSSSGGTLTGHYIKIGRFVYLTLTAVNVSKNTLSGIVSVGNFPFEVNVVNATATCRWELGAGGVPAVGTTVLLPQSSGGTSIDIQQFSNSGYLDVLRTTNLGATFSIYNITYSYITLN